MESPMYTAEGKEKGNIQLPESVFNVPWNGPLMHQVVTSMQDNARTPVAHVKTRGEVRGGGKKPWRQKGTGRARAGSSRSPLWRGGGVTFGPTKDRNFSKKMNVKMKRKAICMVLSDKVHHNEFLILDSIDFKNGKTKPAVAVLKTLEKNVLQPDAKAARSMLIITDSKNELAQRALRNVVAVSFIPIQNIIRIEASYLIQPSSLPNPVVQLS